MTAVGCSASGGAPQRRQHLIARARRQRTDRLGRSTCVGRITRSRPAFLGFLACAPTTAVTRPTSAVASGMAAISTKTIVIRGWDPKSGLRKRIDAKSHRHAADYRTGTPHEGSSSLDDQASMLRSATCAAGGPSASGTRKAGRDCWGTLRQRCAAGQLLWPSASSLRAEPRNPDLPCMFALLFTPQPSWVIPTLP